MKAWRIPLGFLAFSLFALAIFAAPVWYGWRVNVGTLRVFVPEDMRVLPELFHREGADAVAAAIRSRSDPSGREVIVFAGPGKEVLAGTLRRWPSEIPDAPGTYGHVIDRGDGSLMRIVVSHEFLPGGHQLIMGRQSVGLMSLEALFWYGMAGAAAIVLALGLAFAWLLRRQHGQLEALAERRTAELRDSQERYARVMKASEDGFWEWIVASDEFYASARMLAMYGLPPDTVFRGRADFFSRFPFHEEDLQRWRDAVAAHLAGESARIDLEVRVDVQGRMRWMHLSAICQRDAAGAEERWTGSVSDVTARRDAQEALRRSEERYALAMEASEEGHFDWNVQTDEVFASESLKTLLGLPADAPLRSRSDMLSRVAFYAGDGERVARIARDALAGGATHLEFEYRLFRGAGTPRWSRVRWKILRGDDGAARRVVGTVSDITERKKAADELRESEARFRALTGISSDWYWRQDENLRFSYLSEGVSDRAGWPGEEYLGRLRWEVPDIHLISCSWEEHKALLARRQPFRDLEYWRPGKDGPVYSSISGAPIFDEDGEFKGYQGVGRNITERKRFEEALRLSEERYELAMRASGAGHWDWKIESDEFYASPRYLEFGGFPADMKYSRRDDVVAKIPFHPDDKAKYEAGVAAHFAGETASVDMVIRVVPHGGTRWLHVIGVCSRDADGKPVRWAGSVTDITARRRVEEALRLSEARYARALDASADGVWEWSVASDELFISPRARELWGIPEAVEIRTRAELKARNLQFTEDTIRECMARASGVEMTYSVLNQAGELRWIRSTGKVFLGEHGEPMLVTGSLTDVTEGKLAADALRLSEEELRARQEMLDLAQKAASAVAFEWHLGPGEGENRWSPDLEAMYGLEPGSYDGTYETWKKLVFPADWPAASAAIRRAQDTGDLAAEYRIVHRDGAVRWLQAKGRMFLDEARNPARVVGFMIDVSDRHQAEEELRRLERQLRQAQRLEAMGTLAGGIAHDFNNILGAILGYGEMALRAAPHGSRLARDLDSIIVAGERGRALVDRVLAFSRSGVGERVPVHVEGVVGEALNLISAKLPPNVALRAKLRAGRAAILGDATQVHQVVMNLATNAVQAMAAGGELRVSLGVTRLERARVPTIGIIDSGEYLVLEVADDGAGIPPDVLERIFDPFFTTKEVGTGTGLGLSLVHGIVAELGGAIDVASSPGAGSTFTVYLPRSGDTVDAPLDEPAEVPRGDGQRVLVVDDEEALVRLATRTLEELGYVPVGFTSSRAALAAFRADPQRFDALVTDERMPGMSGSALIREVRGIRERMPVVMMSGFIGGAVATRAREAGAEEVLKKPLSARDLAASLARILHP